MRFQEAADAYLAIAITDWVGVLWLKVAVVSLLNYLAFIKAVKALEPVFAPWPHFPGVLGATSPRPWSKRLWHAIKFGSASICVCLAIAHLNIPEAEPYLIVWGFLTLPAARFVANGLSTRKPKVWYQSMSTKTANVLAEFAPFQHIPKPYKAPIALLSFVLALLWALWLGLERSWPSFFNWISSDSTAVEHVVQRVKRSSSSAAGLVWAPAVLNAVVTLACHGHKTWRDGQKDVATNNLQNAMLQKLTTLADQNGAMLNRQGVMLEQLTVLVNQQGAILSQQGAVLSHQGAVLSHQGALLNEQEALLQKLTVSNDQLPDSIAVVVTQQGGATLSQPPTTSSLQHHTMTSQSVASVSPVMTSTHASDVSLDVVSTAGSMLELTEMNSIDQLESGDHVAATSRLTLGLTAPTTELLNDRYTKVEDSNNIPAEEAESDDPLSSGRHTEPPDRSPPNKVADVDNANDPSETDDAMDIELRVGSPSNSSSWVNIEGLGD